MLLAREGKRQKRQEEERKGKGQKRCEAKEQVKGKEGV